VWTGPVWDVGKRMAESERMFGLAPSNWQSFSSSGTVVGRELPARYEEQKISVPI